MPIGRKIPRTVPIWMRSERNVKQIVKRHWLKAVLLVACAYTFWQKDVSIGVQFGSSNEHLAIMEWNGFRPQPARLIGSKSDDASGNTYSNMLYNQAGPEEKEKVRRQLNYVSQYAHWAQDEMRDFGIPASITLAQGLLESNAGESRLARENLNHFGIKCFSKTCTKGHCRNFEDDHHKDFFRVYSSEKESFRAHSQLLQAQRYSSLKALDPKDYKGWAHGLKKAGYATDKAYAEKLIQIIEDLNLTQYDER